MIFHCSKRMCHIHETISFKSWGKYFFLKNIKSSHPFFPSSVTLIKSLIDWILVSEFNYFLLAVLVPSFHPNKFIKIEQMKSSDFIVICYPNKSFDRLIELLLVVINESKKNNWNHSLTTLPLVQYHQWEVGCAGLGLKMTLAGILIHIAPTDGLTLVHALGGTRA